MIVIIRDLCILSSYLLLIVIHLALITCFRLPRRNFIMSKSQDNLSKPIKITVADDKQIDAVFNPQI